MPRPRAALCGNLTPLTVGSCSSPDRRHQIKASGLVPEESDRCSPPLLCSPPFILLANAGPILPARGGRDAAPARAGSAAPPPARLPVRARHRSWHRSAPVSPPGAPAGRARLWRWGALPAALRVPPEKLGAGGLRTPGRGLGRASAGCLTHAPGPCSVVCAAAATGLSFPLLLARCCVFPAWYGPLSPPVEPQTGACPAG